MARSTAAQALVGFLLAFSSAVKASPDQVLCNTIKTKLGNDTVQSTDSTYEALSTENWYCPNLFDIDANLETEWLIISQVANSLGQSTQIRLTSA